MESPPSYPLVFANRVIRQFADHLLGSDLEIRPNDYTVLRVVFRSCGGNWEKLVGGDIKHLTLLEKVVTSWGKMPGRQRQKEES